ncbi:hypothetical protein CY34DRAFT_14715 [Suillus luteus UH-Slu-Lm8-n1]|uniref:Uncharacterized protein n=1 Tax=Suillus luteus UH-Slu-Lm8-n1 TaxID=930992 RepID=A0A0D0AX53_9AGAM|nr:hypothetical protein CY34DRAFT_14715 [Suillus luteus UH-Slu-Lm8-n1]
MVSPPSSGKRVPVTADLKTEPMVKTQKGFFSTLFQSCSPKWASKSATGRLGAPEVPSHTPSESLTPAHDLSRVQSAPQPIQNKVGVVPDVPRFKSIKDNLHELGLTTPVVITQPQVAGSEPVLSQLDMTATPRTESFLQHALSHNTGHASPKSRHESSRRNASMASDHAINIELPVLNITSAPIQSAPSPSSSQASRVDPVEKITIPVSTAHDKTPPPVQGGSNISNREPPVPSSPSTASRSTTQSNRSRTTSSGRPRTAPGRSSELSRRTSTASAHPQRHVPEEPASMFSVDEGFFGRPKIPPPLKVIPKKGKKHQRTQTLASPSSTMTHEQPLTRALSTRSHITRQAPAWLANEPVGLFPIPNDLPSAKSVALAKRPSVLSRSRSSPPPPLPLDSGLEFPPSPLRIEAPNERSLSRIDTQTTVTSQQTQFSPTSTTDSPPARWAWTPPSSWSGPSSAVSSESGDGSHGSKKVTFSSMARLRRPKSSSRSVASIPQPPYSHPNTSSPNLSPSATTKLGKGRVPPIAQEKSDRTGVMVKMQGHDGDWEEAALQDVIPCLREMKSS